MKGMAQSSGPVYSNVSLIKRALFLQNSGVLPLHEIVLFTMKNWSDINYEEAHRLVDYALYAKNSYFREISESGLWSLKYETDCSMDEVHTYMQHERQPLTVRKLTNKFKAFDTHTLTTLLSMDIRFSAINSNNMDYWILSTWELANDVLYEHMQNEQIGSIDSQEANDILTNIYGMDGSTLIFSPQIDGRFLIKGRIISIELSRKIIEKNDAEVIPEILEEVARASLLVYKYIEQNPQIKTSKIVTDIFGIKPFERQFDFYCKAVDLFLSTMNEFEVEESGIYESYNEHEQIEPEIEHTPFWDYSVRGYHLPILPEISGESESVELLRVYSENPGLANTSSVKLKRLRYVTYFERVKGYLYIPREWILTLKQIVNGSLDVHVDGFSYTWKVSKIDKSPFFYGNGVMDFFSDFLVDPGQKIIMELVNEREMHVRLGEVDAKRAGDQARILDIGKLVFESRLVNKSFFGIMVEILATHPSGIHNMVLFEKVNLIRSANHSTINSLLYSNKCFVQSEGKKGYWKLDIKKLSRIYFDENGSELEEVVEETSLEEHEQVKSLPNNDENLIWTEENETFIIPQLWETFSFWSRSQPGHRFSKLVEMASNRRELEVLIVHSYSKLVCKIASNRSTHFMKRMDFVQEGFIGLLKAIDQYREDSTTSFGNYSKYHVLSRMLRKELDNQSLIRIPVHWYETIREFERIVNKFVNEEKSWPTSVDLLKLNENWNQQKLQELERLTTLKNIDYISFEQFWDSLGDRRLNESYPWYALEILDSKSRRLFFEEKSTRFIKKELQILCEIVEEDSELLFDPIQIDDIILSKDLRKQLEDGLKQLTERQERVLRLRYGFDDENERTLDQVAKYFGLTRERIRQIESTALGRLRNILGSLRN